MVAAVAIFWCVFGTVNYTVNADAVVFPFSEARPVTVPYEGTVDHVVAINGQKVMAGDALVSIRSELATTMVTAPETGVVLTSKAAESRFAQREAIVWMLPQEALLYERELLGYVQFEDLRKVKVGSKVQVTPADLEREKWGYAVGRVTGMEQYPTSRERVAERLKLAELASIVPDGEAVYEVRIVLDRDDDGLIWSRKKSEDVAISTGMPCRVQIIWKKKRVWEVLVGEAENTVKTMLGK